MSDSDSFLFVACQAGAEKALKQELSRAHREFKFAYSRPGFVTFKSQSTFRAGFELRSVFARAYGQTLGRAKGSLELRCQAARMEAEKLRALLGKARLRLHVFERDFHVPGDEPLGFEPGLQASLAHLSLSEDAFAAGIFEESPVACQVGEGVFDVIVVEPDLWWFGWHAHSDFHHPYPGGNPRIALDPSAPSRAYIKIQEAILWSQAPLRPGDQAIDIGSAPGGASFALLKRGLKVFGIDPAEMDPIVQRHPSYRHLSKSVSFVESHELPAKVQWLVLDMNTEPKIALTEAIRIAQAYEGELLGVLLTVKLNQWKFSEWIPRYLEELRRGIRLSRLRATQLAHNRQEFFVYGMTREGLAR